MRPSEQIALDWAADYFPWGAVQNQVVNNFDNHYRFAGQEWDSGTGTYYFPFRYYTPTAARFLTADPADLWAVDIANPQSWGKYTHVLNSPVTLIDPLGLALENRLHGPKSVR